MKRIFAFLVAISLAISLITVSFAAVPAFQNTKWCTPPTGFGGGSRVIRTDTVVTYAELSSMRISVNQWLSDGQYSGFRGTASLTYSGSFYYIQLVQDGTAYWLCNSSGGRYRTEAETNTEDKTSTVPSTSAPTTSTDDTVSPSTTYVPSDPSTPSDRTSELSALNSILQYINLEIRSLHGIWRTLINQYDLQSRIRKNVFNAVTGINKLITGTYEQIDLLTGYLPRLDDIYNRLFNIQSASWASVDVENRIYAGVAGLASSLNGVICNGAVQVDTTALEARMDKLISMYSKVNSVVLDTAAVNGSQITDAVGGTLDDVTFWGLSGKSNNKFDVGAVEYTLNGVTEQIAGITLRGMSLGASVPDTVPADDTLLMAGVWQTGGGTYRISDTYYPATGEYVQRIKSLVLDGSESWQMYDKGNGVYLFRAPNLPLADLTENRFSMPSISGWTANPWRASAFAAAANDDAANYVNRYCIYRNYVGFLTKKYTSLDAWKSYLSSLADGGTPMELWYVPLSGAASMTADRAAIGIPEGDSTISASRVRITGKYETYSSFTQTADIISAINNLRGTGIGGDLTEVTTRLDSILSELQSSSGSASCEHTYQQHMEQEAACTLPGLQVSTCSQCGDSYSEIVDPLGHDWQCTDHVAAVTDPETGEETAAAYDVYTCSRCGDTYNDYSGSGAPDEDYSNTSISHLVVKVFSKLGTFAGKLIGFVVHLFDKAITSLDNVVTKFNDYVTQISGFGGEYPAWLTGFWAVLPAELQVALTFAVICMALGVVGKKLFFS